MIEPGALMAVRRALTWRDMVAYTGAQIACGILGAWAAHLMFEVPILQWSAKVRSGPAQWLAEAVATTGLLLVILRTAPSRVAAGVAAYIGAAYWFTASTSFANPAAAFGRMFSDSFAGISPADVPGFAAAQLLGAALGLALHRVLGEGRGEESSKRSGKESGKQSGKQSGKEPAS